VRRGHIDPAQLRKIRDIIDGALDQIEDLLEAD